DRADRRAVTDRALSNDVGEEAAEVEAYFARSRTINLITVQNPAFREFYAAPGPRSAKVRARGQAIREAENALVYLQRMYPASIGEVCFIERCGAEDESLARRIPAPFRTLSRNERLNVFFQPTFALRPGQVYQ